MDIEDAGWAFLPGVAIVATIALERVIRDAFISPLIGEYISHVVGAVVLSCVVIALAYLFVRNLRRRHISQSLRGYRKDVIFVGPMWLVMSIVVEVIRQYVTRSHAVDISWMEYNILKGRLMGLVWLLELVAPYVFGVVLLRHRHIHPLRWLGRIVIRK